MQRDDLAHHDDGGVGEAVFDGFFGQRADGGGEAAVLRGGPPVDEGGGRVGGQARFDKVAGDVGQVLHAHDKDQRVRAGRQRLPVVHGTGLVGILVPGNEGHGRGEVAVRQGDARIGGTGDGA